MEQSTVWGGDSSKDVAKELVRLIGWGRMKNGVEIDSKHKRILKGNTDPVRLFYAMIPL